jgi:hypothetical protein
VSACASTPAVRRRRSLTGAVGAGGGGPASGRPHGFAVDLLRCTGTRPSAGVGGWAPACWVVPWLARRRGTVVRRVHHEAFVVRRSKPTRAEIRRAPAARRWLAGRSALVCRAAHLRGDGLQQAKDYAAILGLKFAYATSGRGIVEFDYLTGEERTVASFPRPDELWARLRTAQRIADDAAARLLTPSYHHGGKVPRYYQEIAISRTVRGCRPAVCSSGRGRRLHPHRAAARRARTPRIRLVDAGAGGSRRFPPVPLRQRAPPRRRGAGRSPALRRRRCLHT